MDNKDYDRIGQIWFVDIEDNKHLKNYIQQGNNSFDILNVNTSGVRPFIKNEDKSIENNGVFGNFLLKSIKNHVSGNNSSPEKTVSKDTGFIYLKSEGANNATSLAKDCKLREAKLIKQDKNKITSKQLEKEEFAQIAPKYNMNDSSKSVNKKR